MKPLHTLLINQYYPPDTAATAKVAHMAVEKLAKRHRVTVLCGRPSYDPTEYHPYYIHRRTKQDKLAIERVGSTAYHRGPMRRRVVNYLSYLGLALPRALAINADIILSMTDPPIAGLVGALVSRIKRRPFVYNIMDLYPDMAIAGSIVRPSRWVEQWERWHCHALRQATRVILLGED